MPSVNDFKPNGRTWWRSLDEVVKSDAFQSHLKEEFPEGARDLFATGNDRRHFLKIMGASMALAGLGMRAVGGGLRKTSSLMPIDPKEQCPVHPNTLPVVLILRHLPRCTRYKQ